MDSPEPAMFRVPRHRRPMTRHEEAPPYDGTVHWYWDDDKGIWRAFRVEDVRPVKTRRRRL